MESPKKIFFYCQAAGTPDNAAFQHSIVVIAEGLRQLGISYYADKDYWRLSPDTQEYLFAAHPYAGPADCDVVVVNSSWMNHAGALPEGLFRADRKYITVYIDSDDGLYTHTAEAPFRKFDIILRTHFNARHSYPKNVIPWQFGLSNRMIASIGEPAPYGQRAGGALCNFRVGHTVRDYAKRHFLPGFSRLFDLDSRTDIEPDAAASPLDRLMWEQTGRRHYPGYFARLREARACFAFGGYFSSPYPRSITNPLLRKAHALVYKLGLKTDVVIQFDSWRFWEALVSGCVALHVDLSKYGCKLPVMPENWKHYVGIDLDDIEGSLADIEKNLPRFAEISKAGREWALKHYDPVSVAKRFLDIIDAHQEGRLTA